MSLSEISNGIRNAPWCSGRAIFYSFVHRIQVKITLTTTPIIVIWKFNLGEGEDKN